MLDRDHELALDKAENSFAAEVTASLKSASRVGSIREMLGEMQVP